MPNLGKVYDSWKDGSDVYKNSKGYYVFQYDWDKKEEYKMYLPKSWKPKPASEAELKAIRKRTRKPRKHKRATRRI